MTINIVSALLLAIGVVVQSAAMSSPASADPSVAMTTIEEEARTGQCAVLTTSGSLTGRQHCALVH